MYVGKQMKQIFIALHMPQNSNVYSVEIRLLCNYSVNVVYNIKTDCLKFKKI